MPQLNGLKTKLRKAAEATNDPTVKGLLDAEKRVKAAEYRAKMLDDQNRHLKQELDAAEKRQEFLDELPAANGEAWDRKKNISGTSTAILVLTDWHTEESVDPATVNGLNEFNLDIAAARVKKATDGALRMLDKERTWTKIDSLIIGVLGDLITGHIHPELQASNNLHPTEAILYVQELLTNALTTIVKHAKCKDILVATSYGNHGRTGEKPRISTSHKNSFEWLLYKTLEQSFRPKGLRWQVANSYFNYVETQGMTLRFHHGDWMKFHGGVGGLSIPAHKAIDKWNEAKWADFDFFGHYHHYLRTHKFCCCDSLIGYAPYGIYAKGTFRHPAQLFATVNQKHGLTLAEPIFCT